MPAVFKRYSVSFQAEIINLEIQSIVIDGTLLLSPSVSIVTGALKVRTPTREGPWAHQVLPRLLHNCHPTGSQLYTVQNI